MWTPLSCAVFALMAIWSANAVTVPQRHENCKARADLLFILDGSGSIGSEDYRDLKKFVARMSQEFEVGGDAVLIGALVFSSSMDYALKFSLSQTNSMVATAIQNLDYPGQGTDTAEALEYARTHCFDTSHGARQNTSRIAIVFTDGHSNNRPATEREATLLKDSGVTCLAVGIGSGVDQRELEAIASSPSMTFNVVNFQVLDTISNHLLTWACPDACSTNASACTESPNQVCVDLEDGFECRCAPDTVRDNRGICADPDQCALDSTLCRDSPNQVCVNSDQGYRCECQTGHALDRPGGTCEATCERPNANTCESRADGDYPACKPHCADGTFYSCVAGGRYVRTCPLGNFLRAGSKHKIFVPLVYDPDTSRCQNITSHCPRPHLTLPVS